MNLYKHFKTDENKEAGEGIELKYGDSSITIHRAGGSNAKFRKQNDANLRKYGRDIDLGTLDDETDRKIMVDLYVDTVIIGWKNITDENGNPLEYNRENVVKLLNDLPELFADIRRVATNVAFFKEKELEEDLGKPKNA